MTVFPNPVVLRLFRLPEKAKFNLGFFQTLSCRVASTCQNVGRLFRKAAGFFGTHR